MSATSWRNSAWRTALKRRFGRLNTDTGPRNRAEAIPGVHLAASYLIYAAVVVRAAAFYEQNPSAQSEVYGLLALFGLLLVTEPLVTRRFAVYPYIYLIVESALVLVLLLEEPGMDFLPALFFPLSFQAVTFFRRRLGFLWIGGFSVLMAWPLMFGWGWKLQGVASVLINSATSFFVGNFSHIIQKADQARLENEQLYAELGSAYRQLQEHAARVEELAAAQERSHLARELHDSVTQTLFSMNLAVQGAQLLVAKEPERVDEQLDRVQELARSAAGEIQVLVSQLQPRSVTEQGLSASLVRLAADRERRDGLKVCLEINGASRDKELPEAVAAGLYRIAQEALNNVVKHAGTDEAWVQLELESQPCFLQIEDHGAGFNQDKVSPSLDHLGLAGMADRARELGWVMQISSQPGQGTRVRVEEVRNGF